MANTNIETTVTENECSDSSFVNYVAVSHKLMLRFIIYNFSTYLLTKFPVTIVAVLCNYTLCYCKNYVIAQEKKTLLVLFENNVIKLSGNVL